MLVDDIIKYAGSSPVWIMKNALPHIFHLLTPETKDMAVRKIASVIAPVVDGWSAVYPTCNGKLFPGEAEMKLDYLHTIGMTVDPIYVEFSSSRKCTAPIRQKDIAITRRLFDSISAIHPFTASPADTFYSVAYEIATLSYDDTTENNFIKIYRALIKLAVLLIPGQYHTFGEIYRNALMDYLDFRDMMSTSYGIDDSMLGIERGDMPDAIINDFVTALVALSGCDKNTEPDAVTDFATKALVFERMIAWMITGKFDVLREVSSIPKILIRKLTLNPKVPPLQQLIAQSAVIATKSVSGETDWISKVLNLHGTCASDASLKSKDKPNDIITANYICGQLSDFIDNLSPDDISFDIPEERLAMLVHDLGSKKFKITECGDGYAYYYREEGELEYKLFMAQDSARIVYGINNAGGKVNLIRFSDGSPKFDYVYTY